MRRAGLRLALSVAVVVSTVGSHASAQIYPGKPIRMLFGSTPGSGAGDQSARLLAQNGYPNRTPVVGANVVFPAELGLERGQLVRPSVRPGFFGRVYATD